MKKIVERYLDDEPEIMVRVTIEYFEQRMRVTLRRIDTSKPKMWREGHEYRFNSTLIFFHEYDRTDDHGNK